MVYVLFDSMVSCYLKANGKPTNNWRDAKQYKRLGMAISPSTGAGLLNTNRNLPPGQTKPSKYYQNLPQVEVHEFDNSGQFVRSHAAPPSYITL